MLVIGIGIIINAAIYWMDVRLDGLFTGSCGSAPGMAGMVEVY